MQTISAKRAAIYIKEAAGYHPEENSKELPLQHCEEFCKAHEIETVARYYDAPGIRPRLRTDDGRGHPTRTALQFHRNLQA